MGSVQATTNGQNLTRATGFSATTDQVTVAGWFRLNAFNSFNALWSFDNGSAFYSPFTDGTHSNNLVIDHNGTGSAFANWINFGTPPTGQPFFLAVTSTTTSAPVVAWYGVGGLGLTRTASSVNFGGFPSSTLTVFDESAADAVINGACMELTICSGPNGALGRPQIEALYRKPRGELPAVPGLYFYSHLDQRVNGRIGIDLSGKGNHFTVNGTFGLRPEGTVPLWTSPKAFSFLRIDAVAGGGSNTPMTLNATQTQTVSAAQRAAARSLQVTASQTLTRLRAAARSLTATQVQVVGAAPTMIDGQSFTATQTQTVASPTRAATRTLSITATQAATLQRALGKLLSATDQQVASVARALAATRTVTQAQAATLAKGAGTLRTISVVAAQLATLQRTVGATRSATEAQAATVQRAAARTLLVTATQTLTRLRALARALGVTAVQVPTESHTSSGGAGSMTLSATCTQAASYARACAQALSRTAAAAPTVQRTLTRPGASATQVQVPSLIKGQGFFRNASATCTQAATRLREVLRPRAATVVQVPAVPARQLAVTRLGQQAQLPTVNRLAALVRTLNVIAAQSGSVARGRALMMVATVVQTGSATWAAAALFVGRVVTRLRALLTPQSRINR